VVVDQQLENKLDVMDNLNQSDQFMEIREEEVMIWVDGAEAHQVAVAELAPVELVAELEKVTRRII
jgi:hypothetical protein